MILITKFDTKAEISPVVAAVVIILVLAVAAAIVTYPLVASKSSRPASPSELRHIEPAPDIGKPAEPANQNQATPLPSPVPDKR